MYNVVSIRNEIKLSLYSLTSSTVGQVIVKHDKNVCLNFEDQICSSSFLVNLRLPIMMVHDIYYRIIKNVRESFLSILNEQTPTALYIRFIIWIWQGMWLRLSKSLSLLTITFHLVLSFNFSSIDFIFQIFWGLVFPPPRHCIVSNEELSAVNFSPLERRQHF